MRALAAAVSVSIHAAVAVALPARAPAAPVVATVDTSPSVWVVLPQRPPPVAELLLTASAAGRRDAPPSPAIAEPQLPRPPLSPRPAKHAARAPAAAAPAQALPLAVAGASAGGVAVAAEDDVAAELDSVGAVSVSGGTADGIVRCGDGGDGAALGRGAGTERDELDGRGGDVDPLVAAWLKALRAHLSRTHRYPDWLAERGLQGTVVLRLHIQADGRLRAVEPRGDAERLLLQAAREVLADAGRLPPPPTSLGAEVRVRLPFTFRLDD